MSIRPTTLITTLFLLLLGTIIVVTGMGFLAITPTEVIRIVADFLFDFPVSDSMNPAFTFVVLDVRLPRIITATLVGGGLAVAGNIFQALLLNPLADPYTLGVSSGAAFGASLALLFALYGIPLPSWFSVPVLAFAGAMATLFTVFALASPDGRLSSNTLILSGVIVSAILSAGIGFMKYLADEQVSVIIFWLMGSFVGRSWPDVLLTASFVLPGFGIMLFFARDLNIMALGQRTADTLGVETVKMKKTLLLCASLITAICVSVSGVIGFVGLIVPHLVRIICGPDNRILLPACFLSGGLLLLLADTITRAILPSEIPIGILTSLIGGPFFCYIFYKKQVSRQ